MCMSFVTPADPAAYSIALHCFQIEQLGKHVTTVRHRLETDEEALLIADEAPQHSDDEPLKLHRIRDCKIPKKTTHAYQPAY